MRHSTIHAALVIAAGAGLASCSADKATVGPFDGDVIAVMDGAVNAEVVTNAQTGEVLVQTWKPDSARRQAIPAAPISLGTASHVVVLAPHPIADDPPGESSRFYGQADWLRGGMFDHGWLRCCGAGAGSANDGPPSERTHVFWWTNCWNAGHKHPELWSDIAAATGPR